MKNFTLATLNAINYKCVYMSRAIEKFFRIKKFESLAYQEMETTLVLVRESVVIRLNKPLTKNLKKILLPIRSEEICENKGSHTLNFLICREINQSSKKC